MSVSVFGKLPSQPDFLRLGHSSKDVREAERWLIESCEDLRGEGLDLPGHATCFVLSSPSWSEVVVGLAVGSRDAVGRHFPIAVFDSVDTALVAGRGWLLPVVFEHFLEEAERALVRAAQEGDARQLAEDVERLPPIDPTMFLVAEQLFDTMVKTHGVVEFESRVFPTSDDRFYAYRTLTIACDKVRGAFPAHSSTVLGCPAIHYTDFVIWSALVARVLRWPVALPMVWAREPVPAVLISLGSPPVQTLRFLVDADADSVRYWPLTTQHEGALASARDALESVAKWDEDDEALEGLFERIASLV